MDKEVRARFTDLIRELEEIPEYGERRSFGEAGVALAALAIHCGSYFSVIAGGNAPGPEPEGVRRMHDWEMRRIEEEAVVGVSALISMYITEEERFWSLVRRASSHLPVPRRTAFRAQSVELNVLCNLADPGFQNALAGVVSGSALLKGLREAEREPVTRLAQWVVWNAWCRPLRRAMGVAPPASLKAGRFSRGELRTLFIHVSDSMTAAMWAVYGVGTSLRSGVPPERAMLGYSLAESLSSETGIHEAVPRFQG